MSLQWRTIISLEVSACFCYEKTLLSLPILINFFPYVPLIFSHLSFFSEIIVPIAVTAIAVIGEIVVKNMRHQRNREERSND